MFLRIDDKYAISSDSYQWIINIKGKKKGETVWRPTNYYPTFQMCVDSLAERLVRDSDAQSFVEAIEDAKAVSAKLSEALRVDIPSVPSE